MKIIAALLTTGLMACTGHAGLYATNDPGHPRRPPPSEPAGPPPPPPHEHHQPTPPPPPGPPQVEWVELGAPQKNDDNRDFIELKNQGRYARLRVDVTRGSIMLNQLLVQFGNEKDDMKVKVGKKITAGESVELDLPGNTRSIGRIVIYMDPSISRRDRGEYRVFGR